MTLLGSCSGISFVDFASLEVFYPKRIHHKVFKGIAKGDKTLVGYFYGFKLPLIVNDEKEILAYMITAGNVDDRKSVSTLTE